MSPVATAIVAIVLVLGLIAGLIFSLRRSSQVGLPSKDVLDKTKRRAREMDARDAADED